MPAINFMEKFVVPIQLGEKKHTIRVERKSPFKTGDTLFLYTGQRTSHCERIAVFPCRKVRPIQIYVGPEYYQGGIIFLNDRWIPNPDVGQDFARNDGFDSFQEMYQFFSRYDEETRMNKLRLIQWAETEY